MLGGDFQGDGRRLRRSVRFQIRTHQHHQQLPEVAFPSFGDQFVAGQARNIFP